MLLPLVCLAGAPQAVWDSGELKDAPFAPEASRAVTDKPLVLSGQHSIRMDSACMPESLKGFAVSAWVRPDAFDRYNEIFRIESNSGRVLFSFQESGTVLALGLDVNGSYRECDARIRPEQVLDGCWHFVAATFDGREYWVYLDGAVIGQLPHGGEATVARAPGFVGSHGGGSEFFRGGLDDLRLYAETLTPAMLTEIFKAGASKLTARTMAAMPAEWKPFLQERSTFAATLLEARKMLQKSGLECPAEVKQIFAMNLSARFPDECGKYVRLFRQAPARFVFLKDLSELKGMMEKQVTSLTEYMPLTDEQWAHCPPEERQRWQSVKEWSERMAARIPEGGDALGWCCWKG